MNSKIDLSKITSLKTKAYLKLHALKNTEDLKTVVPMCYTQENHDDFLLHEKTYLVPYSRDEVWRAYTQIPPSKAWCGRRVGFSFSFDLFTNTINYMKDKYNGLFEGQLIFLEVRAFLGLVKLAVTHQVNTLDRKNFAFKFCYVEGGKSAGSQMISLVEKGPKSTEIIHNTYYRSDSPFRDKYLYPFVHERIINEFHNNVKLFLQEQTFKKLHPAHPQIVE